MGIIGIDKNSVFFLIFVVKIIMKLILSVFFFSVSILASAQNYQDSILLVNGVSYQAKVIDFKGGILHFESSDKKGEPKHFEVSQSSIFSYHEKGTFRRVCSGKHPTFEKKVGESIRKFRKDFYKTTERT